MSSTVDKPGSSGKKRWLLTGLLVAVLFTLFFGVRTVWRFTHRPTNEPIREWMSIRYVAHSYQVPARKLMEELGIPPDKERADRSTIKQIAKELGKSSDEIIAQLQTAIERARPPRPPPHEDGKKTK